MNLGNGKAASIRTTWSALCETVEAFIAKPWHGFLLEFRLRHKDGSYRWMLVHGSLEHDEQGKPVRLRGSQLDFTERKKAELALRESEAQHREVLAALGEGVTVRIPNAAASSSTRLPWP